MKISKSDVSFLEKTSNSLIVKFAKNKSISEAKSLAAEINLDEEEVQIQLIITRDKSEFIDFWDTVEVSKY